MIRMPKRVLKRWRALFDELDRGDDTIIELLLSSRLDSAATADALTLALRHATLEYERTHTEPVPHHGELPYAGEWSVTPVPEGGLLVGGRKSDDIAGDLLAQIAADLDRQGVRGKLDLYQRPEAPQPPESVGAIAAKLRIAGHRGSPSFHWTVDEDALARLVVAAVEWCLDVRPDRALTVQSGANPWMVLRRADPPVQRVRELMFRDHSTILRSIGEDRFRSVSVRPRFGDITVLEAGPCLHRAGWEPTLASLTRFITDARNDTVYARIERASHHEGEHAQPEGGGRVGYFGNAVRRYEDHLAPDIYPVQLLGPGYPKDLPADDMWRTESLGPGYTLLKHSNPAAWLGEPDLQKALRGKVLPDPDMVQDARRTFAPILFPVLDDPGYPDSHPRDPPRPDIWLPQSLADQGQAVPPSDDGLRAVEFLLRSGQTLGSVKLDRGGAKIAEITGNRCLTMNPHEIAAVRPDRGATPPTG